MTARFQTVEHAGATLARVGWARVRVDDGTVRRALRLAGPDDLARARHFRYERDQRRGLVRRATARRLVAMSLRSRPEQVAFARTALGQPSLADGGIAVSVAYADDLVLVATSPAGSVGCDIAARAIAPDEWPGADAVFGVAEVAAIRAAAARGAGQDAFLRAWTLKEACGKALGIGLIEPLDHIDTRPAWDDVATLSFAGRHWLSRSWECGNGYRAAIVVAMRLSGRGLSDASADLGRVRNDAG